ncbi:hypothetical protein G5I_04751 [Acromyrmex echinatior]|uniref:Uncharacterized protein n=1 Tax=Acromyrmex echinatior TaxID=103372 RepID=F4WGH3_ACREC|nr:hypothetical protein G5I_04751 [Acromyrmex echinatior]
MKFAIPSECELVTKTQLKLPAIRHCDCSSDALRWRRISLATRLEHTRYLGPANRPPTIAPPQLTGEQFVEISYSPTQPLDLTSPPVIDPAIQEILGYSPLPFEERFSPLPPLEERFPPPTPLEERFPSPPPHEEGFPLPLPFLDQLPPFPFQLNPEPIENQMFRFFTSPSYEGDRLVTVYIPGNPTPYTVLYKHLPMCSGNTFLTSHTR